MALRFLLVGLVASMGFEMPSGSDVESWTRTGRDWVDARVADLSGLRAEADRALFARSADREPARDAVAAELPGSSDLAFEVVSEGMAADFAVDLALARAEEPVLAAEPATIAGLDWPAALPSGESVEGLPAYEDAPAAEVVPPPTRVARLSTAVRLTREAFHAWAILMQPADSVATR